MVYIIHCYIFAFMIYYYNGEINDTYVNDFIERLYSLDEGDVLIHYLCSDGGDTRCVSTLIDVINLPENINRVHIKALNIQSSAFRIFFQVQCKREVMDCCVGMIHQASTEAVVFEGGGVDSNMTTYSNANYEIYLNELNKLIDLGLSKKEIAKYKKSGAVVFSPKQLRELLKNQILKQ